MVFGMVCCQGKFHVPVIPVPSTSNMLSGTRCAKVNQALLAGNDKSQTGLTLKIYELIFDKKSE